MDVSAVPCPVATARIGWTVRERGTGEIVGWVRRADAADLAYRRPPGTYWRIPRAGAGDPINYATVRDAARAFTR